MYLPADFALTAHLSPVNDNDPNADPMQVICAWPLSGQYGFGSRLLFYLLIGTCVVARNRLWLRNTFLAPTLLFPVVAALHSIALASNHVKGAVDMDIYGAFQLCSLGLLAGTVAVRTSKTYFLTPGRNLIFLWVILLLAGLMSLAVEFYRSTPSDCPRDGPFRYGVTMCGLVCSEEEGPQSPLRGGSANDMYVIPAPVLPSFRSAMLLSAGCCVHAIVWLLYMADKILREGERHHSGDNGSFALVTNQRVMTGVNVVVFGGAGLTLLVVGELNLHSDPLLFETEPLSSIGQWSSMVTAALAAVGSLLIPLYADMADVRAGDKSSEDGQSYRVAVFFIKLEDGFDEFVSRLARKSKGEETSEYPLVPGEEDRLDHAVQVAASQAIFSTSRSSSIARPRDSEGRTYMTEVGMQEPQPAHIQHRENAGSLDVPVLVRGRRW